MAKPLSVCWEHVCSKSLFFVCNNCINACL